MLKRRNGQTCLCLVLAGYSIQYQAFDLSKQQARTAKERGFSLHSQTIQEVTEAHAKARKQFKKSKLRWRISSGSKRSLGWVPFKKGASQVGQWLRPVQWAFLQGMGLIRLKQIRVQGWALFQKIPVAVGISTWLSKVQAKISQGTAAIGIDLGLKTVAACSDGSNLENARIYRGLEKKLGMAQRANKKRLVKTIHAQIKNRRNDAIHKFTNKLTANNGLIVVGNVSSSKLAKTKMAKSVLDAGWFMLKTQLEYKANARSVVFLEVNEAFTTQTCSCCGTKAGPKGLSGLNDRVWQCVECSVIHDRDINSALNILASGTTEPRRRNPRPLGRGGCQ